HGGFTRFGDFVGHAAAEVENDADGNRNIFGGKGEHFLLDVVFEDAEVVGLKAGNEAIVRVGDGNVDERHFDVHLDLATLDGSARTVAADVVLGGLFAGRVVFLGCSFVGFLDVFGLFGIVLGLGVVGGLRVGEARKGEGET